MPNYYSSRDIVCPFYLDQDLRSVTCEGTRPRTQNVTRFHSKDAKDTYVKCICSEMGEYKECPIYTLVDEKYAEG